MLKSAASDLGFFAAFAIIYTFFSLRIVDVLNRINIIISAMSGSLPSGSGMPDNGTMTALAAHKDILMENFTRLLLLLLLLALCTYAIWCVFQGTSWWLAHQRLRNRVSWCRYQQRFSIMSLAWAAVFLLIAYGLVKLSGLAVVGSVELISVETLAKLMGIMLLIVLYFAFVTFSMLDRKLKDAVKGAYTAGIINAKHFVPAYALIIIKTAVVYAILMLAGLDLFWTVLLGLALFIPLAAWARVMFVGVSRENS